MLPLKRILCPTDFSEPSYVALEHAVELARHFDAELCLLHVVPYLPATPPDFGIGILSVTDTAPDAQRMDNAARLLSDVASQRIPPSVQSHCEVKMGYTEKEIACFAKEGHFDWLVIATHGLGGWRHMVFGSVAEAIVRQVHCPVLTVHGVPTVEEMLPHDMHSVKQEVRLIR